MAKEKPTGIMIPPQGGMLRDLVMRIKLILRLMGDRRINFLLKLLPIGSLAYLISPIDLVSGIVLPVIGALDDAAILWLGLYLFLELCPPAVVQEHVKRLASNVDIVERRGEDVVDADAVDLPEDKK